jgi:hypothetical protein
VTTEIDYVIKRIVELCDELETLTDYLDLLMARAFNSGKPRYTAKQAEKILQLR